MIISTIFKNLSLTLLSILLNFEASSILMIAITINFSISFTFKMPLNSALHSGVFN